MIILGWILLTIGAVGTLSAVGLEMVAQEPVYFLVMKLTSGVFGCGGLILWIKSHRK